MSTLVLLQNAWARTARGAAYMRANRSVWLRATAASRSGCRLKVMLGDDCFGRDDVEFGNTTPRVGVGSDAKLPADLMHVRRLLETSSPSVVIACGKQAEEVALEVWNGALICVPHPAHRLLTDELYLRAKILLTGGTVGRVALRQRRGYVDVINLEECEAAR